jgi:hypothetical protein
MPYSVQYLLALASFTDRDTAAGSFVRTICLNPYLLSFILFEPFDLSSLNIARRSVDARVLFEQPQLLMMCAHSYAEALLGDKKKQVMIHFYCFLARFNHYSSCRDCLVTEDASRCLLHMSAIRTRPPLRLHPIVTDVTQPAHWFCGLACLLRLQCCQ